MHYGLKNNAKLTSSLEEEFYSPPLKNAHFNYFVRLIYSLSGLNLTEGKRQLLVTRLNRRLRSLGLSSWDAYIKILESNNQYELEFFTNLLTTNKTSFFRENEHFDYITNDLLEKLKNKGIKNPTFWVAACSSGQEVYSLLMTVLEFNEKHNWDFDPLILATDIDTRVLDTAKKGIYSSEIVENDVPQNLIKKYFLKGKGVNAGNYMFSPDLKKNLKFRKHNLVDSNENYNFKFDLIILRNVIIYFDRKTIDEVCNKMSNHMKPGSHLIIGLCENLHNIDTDLVSLNQSIFRKPTI